MNLEEFTTVVKESEAIVNNRPLTYQQVDSQDIPLTPSQLIRGHNLDLLPTLRTPATDRDEIDNNRLRNQYVILSNTLRTFQRRWRDEYLTSLREKKLYLVERFLQMQYHFGLESCNIKVHQEDGLSMSWGCLPWHVLRPQQAMLLLKEYFQQLQM